MGSTLNRDCAGAARYLVCCFIALHRGRQQPFEFAAWLENPWNALLLSALVTVGMTHARLGIQVVLEDYVHAEAKKLVMLLINQFLFIGLTVLSVFSIIKLHFFGI